MNDYPIKLMPHAVCWNADPHLIWTMVVTNAITFLSYSVICLTLLYLVRKTRHVIARDWAWFVTGFALFIVACGSTHLMDVVTTWVPVFWIDAWTSIVTAVLSATVAVMLIRRASTIGFSINDYADRLANTENERTQMQENLLSARKLEDWSRLSAVVAHEISNPLEAIQNLLYLIRNSTAVTPEIDAFARAAAEEADRVVTISRSTLAFFRESNVPERIDIGQAADSVRFLLDSLLLSSNTTLTIDTTGDLVVEALPGEIRQVFLNLMRNACEASPASTPTAKARVRVSLIGQPDSVRVAIEDEGIGIAPDLLPVLFQFGRTTKGEKGTGMGLWTVKTILDRHAAPIEVASVIGEGTRFTIDWPRKFKTI